MAAREKRSADAESAPVTVADGIHTHGVSQERLSEQGTLDESARLTILHITTRNGLARPCRS